MKAMKNNKEFQQALSLFASILTFTVVTFIVNIAYDSVFFQGLGALGFFFLLGVKVFVYSGIYGHIIELISGEEVIVTLKRVIKNSLQFWFAYFCINLGFFLLHACFSVVTPSLGKIPLDIFYAQLHILILFFMATWIVFVRYVKGKEWKQKRMPLDLSAAGIILGLYSVDMFLFYFPLIVPIDFFGLQNGIAFLQECIRYLEFIFLAILIVKQYPQVQKQFEVSGGKELYLVSPLGGGVFYSFGTLVDRKNPAAFAVLKALTPKDYRIRYFNQYVWRKRYYKSNVLVAITSYTVNSYKAYKMAKDFKNCGAKVVMGGPHMGCLPDEALEFCDSVVIGEAEAVWKQIISDYENGCLQKKYYGGAEDIFCEELQEEILNSPYEEMKDYIETTRGCKYRCDFCAVPGLCGNKIRKKSIEDVVAVIKKLKHKYKKYSFLDNNIYCDPPYARKLFQALKPLNIKWGAGCSIDIAKNKEDLLLAKESGCEGLLFGYEIIDVSDEKEKGGKYSYVNKYIEYSKEVNKLGIEIRGSFITAWEGDRWISLWRLLYFTFKIHPQFAIVNVLTPLPRSNLYNRLLAENRLISLNWRNYGYNKLVFKHKQLKRRLFDFFFALYRPVFFLLSSQYGNLYLIIIIYILLLPYFTKHITFILQ